MNTTEENYSDIFSFVCRDKIKVGSRRKPPYLFYIAYGFVYQLHEQTILSFFQQIYQNKLLWIASNVILLLINLKNPNSFLRLNRVLENSLFWLFTFIVDSVVTFVF